MKMLFVTEYYPPVHLGGAEISLRILVEGLARLGHEITVLTPNYRKFKTEIESSNNNLKIIRFKSPRHFLFKGRKESQKMYLQNKPLFYLQLSQYIKFSSYELKREVGKLIKKEDFDVIHANNLESIFAVSRLKTDVIKIAHLRDFGILCWNRGLNNEGQLCSGCSVRNLMKCMGANFAIASILAYEIKKRRNILNNFDRLIAISNFVKDQFVRQLNIDEKKIAVLYNPLDPEIISELSKVEAREYLRLPIDKRIVLFVGTLTELKGAHVVLELAKRLPQYHFVAVGDGPLREKFLRTSLPNLKYVGYKPSNELKHYYKAADILIVPSLWHEPFGRVIIEGAINGCYVIGSNRGAIPEVIEYFGSGSYISPNIEEIENVIINPIKVQRKRLEETMFPTYHKRFISIVRP